MADTKDLKSFEETHEGSTPSPRTCSICGRFIKKDNKYGACEYPRYCYEKAAAKECESLSNAVKFLM